MIWRYSFSETISFHFAKITQKQRGAEVFSQFMHLDLAIFSCECFSRFLKLHLTSEVLGNKKMLARHENIFDKWMYSKMIFLCMILKLLS